jgi:hypothetical protein
VGPLPLDPSPSGCREFDADALTQEAMASRPDALAAAEAVAAAEARLRFAKLGWVRLLGIADATSGRESHVLGRALRFTVPLFNRNQGGIARAGAELERAVRNQKTVAYQIILDVQRSYLQYRQGCAELDVLLTKVRPEVEGNVRRAQAAYQEGNVPIFVVLEATRQLLDSYLREAVLHGDLRRFLAEFERGVGRRLIPPPQHTPARPLPPPPKADGPASKLDPPVTRADPVAPVAHTAPLGRTATGGRRRRGRVDSREGQPMSRLQRIATALLTLALAALVGAGAWWLVTNKPVATKAEKQPGPATVAKVVKEDDLTTVFLTEEAERRVGLTLAAAESKAVRRVRVYRGEVTVPVGRTILVAAPLGGTLNAPTGGVPKAGTAVKAGTPVFQLTPVLSPDGRATLTAALADANGQVNTAKASFDLTDIAVKRAERVLKEGAGSQRQVDEARAAFDVAKRTLDAATARQSILNKVVGDAEGGTAASITIDAPEDGILRVVSALPGQTVPSGAALFEVVDLSTVWVRVPLPVGDLDGIDRVEPAQVGKLSAPPGSRLPSAQPVAAPPSANPLAATVDVFYELPNADGRLTPRPAGRRHDPARGREGEPDRAVVGGRVRRSRRHLGVRPDRPPHLRPPAGGGAAHRRGRRGAGDRAGGGDAGRRPRRAGVVRGGNRLHQVRAPC